MKLRGWQLTRAAAASIIVMSGAMSGRPVLAQTADPEIAKLQKEIEKRDALIDNLLRRVESLEKKVNTAASSSSGAAIAGSGSPSRSAPARYAVSSQPNSAAAAPLPPARSAPPAGASAPDEQAQVAQAAQPPAGQQQPAGQGQSAPPAPGQFTVTPEAAERALERTLTATGALLVPNGFAEVEPSVQYRRSEFPNLVLFTNNRNEYTGGVATRLGLPFESQVDLSVPYVAAQAQVVNNFVAPPQQTSYRTGYSFGDVTVGLSKTLLHEQGWLPDLIGRVSWEAPTGPVLVNNVALTGSGQNRLNFSLTALKRQDPLAFVASVGYSKAFKWEGIDPGNQVNLVGGVYLATSPETTLSTTLQQSFQESPRIDGVKATAGNLVQSYLTFGASSILGRGLLLDLNAGIGLTNQSSKYFVIVSLPWRFSVPWF